MQYGIIRERDGSGHFASIILETKNRATAQREDGTRLARVTRVNSVSLKLPVGRGCRKPCKGLVRILFPVPTRNIGTNYDVNKASEQGKGKVTCHLIVSHSMNLCCKRKTWIIKVNDDAIDRKQLITLAVHASASNKL
jgi:hypothetical protein